MKFQILRSLDLVISTMKFTGKNEEYIGLGAGAWSYLEGKRFSNIRDPYTLC